MAQRYESHQNGAPVVAELGRPETPQETADRKAAASLRHRRNQNALNLVVALLASLVIVLITVLIVVRPQSVERETVDYEAIAAGLQSDYDGAIISPSVDDDWTANAARIEQGADGVSAWYIGFVTPEDDFIAMLQGFDANPTWLAAQLDDALSTGTTTVDGITWDVYDRRDGDDTGNNAYAMSTVQGASTIVLYGTADDEEFDELATAVSTSIEGSTP